MSLNHPDKKPCIIPQQQQNEMLNSNALHYKPSAHKKKNNQLSFAEHFAKHSLLYFIVITIVIICTVAAFIEPDSNENQSKHEGSHDHQMKPTQPTKNQFQLRTDALPSRHPPPPQPQDVKVTTIPKGQAHKLIASGAQGINPAKQPTAPLPRYTSKRPVAGITTFQRDNAVKWRGLSEFDASTQLIEEEKKYYQEKYKLSQYQELPFCIVVPSFNNAKNNLHLKNMRSIVLQNYSNYHVVFIDDASTDRTGPQVKALLEAQNLLPPSRYVMIRNAEQKRAMPNLRMAAKQYCRPQDIFLIVDGDDELIGRQVLQLFSALFQRQNAWFVYSNFLNIRHSVGYSRPFPAATVKNNKYRGYPFVTSHLRAFYTQLFLNIKEEDLQDQKGNYLKAANDVAICIPILEMCHQRVFYIPELTYYYNSNTGQNNHQIRLKQQKTNDKMLRSRKGYTPIDELFPKTGK